VSPIFEVDATEVTMSAWRGMCYVLRKRFLRGAQLASMDATLDGTPAVGLLRSMCVASEVGRRKQSENCALHVGVLRYIRDGYVAGCDLEKLSQRH
jgi:hypothetical protein